MNDLDGSLNEFRTPILAAFCRIIGVLFLLATILTAIVAVREQVPLPTVILGSAGGILASILAIGIAQVVEYVAKIEHHASSQKNEAILRSLHKIEGHLHAIRERSNHAQIRE